MLMRMAASRWPAIKNDLPEVLYDLKGIRAGIANIHKWQIRINPVLLNENIEEMISQTIGHEIAHLVAFSLWPPAKGRKKEYTRPHGIYWQMVMKEFGLEPDRTHTFNITNSRCYTKKTYEYSCKCRKNISISSVKHNRINRGYVYVCTRCKSHIRLKQDQ